MPPDTSVLKRPSTSASADSFVDQVEQRLARLFQEERSRWELSYPQLRPGLAALESFVLGGGKRIRPRCVYWGNRAAGAEGNCADLVDVGAAIELFHAFALVHDDVMDGSDQRRHQPTIHRQFAAMHRAEQWRGDERRVSEGFAILLGDLAFVYSTMLLRGAPPRLHALFDEMRIELHVGQYLDLSCAATGSAGDVVITDIARFKTAKYTVERPLHIGAALAGRSDLDMCLSRFGMAVGEAFQLRDDLLGVFGSPETTGKPAGDDLRDGKMTLLLQWAIAAERPPAAALGRLGTDSLSDADVAEITAFIIESGAVARAERRIDRLVCDARDVLAHTRVAHGVQDDVIAGLRELAETAAWRCT